MNTPKPKPRELVSLSSAQWNPKKKGERFRGVVIGHRIAQTKYGEKPIVEIANEQSGETIEMFASNVALSKLNRVPVGGYVELEFRGTYVAQIGRKKETLRDIVAYVDKSVKLLPVQQEIHGKGRKQ